MGGAKRVLIIDNSRDDRSLCAQYLASDPDRDYTICEASSGRDGLTRCHSQLPDCILLDYRLPDLDGLELLSMFAANKQSRLIPIIMITGFGNESVAVEAMKRGATDYFVKSRLTRGALCTAVAKALDRAAREKLEATQQIDLERLAISGRERVSAGQSITLAHAMAIFADSLNSSVRSIIGQDSSCRANLVTTIQGLRSRLGAQFDALESHQLPSARAAELGLFLDAMHRLLEQTAPPPPYAAWPAPLSKLHEITFLLTHKRGAGSTALAQIQVNPALWSYPLPPEPRPMLTRERAELSEFEWDSDILRKTATMQLQQAAAQLRTTMRQLLLSSGST